LSLNAGLGSKLISDSCFRTCLSTSQSRHCILVNKSDKIVIVSDVNKMLSENG
jgi:hypothetical protein